MAAELEPNVRRFDELIEGVEWAIATNAEALPEVPETRLRIVATLPVGDVPAMWIYFVIDDADYATMVYLVRAER